MESTSMETEMLKRQTHRVLNHGGSFGCCWNEYRKILIADRKSIISVLTVY